MLCKPGYLLLEFETEKPLECLSSKRRTDGRGKRVKSRRADGVAVSSALSAPDLVTLGISTELSAAQ